MSDTAREFAAGRAAVEAFWTRNGAMMAAWDAFSAETQASMFDAVYAAIDAYLLQLRSEGWRIVKLGAWQSEDSWFITDEIGTP